MSEWHNDSDEPRIVRQAQDGDKDAFARLVRAYQKRAVSVAYRVVGNSDDACDVAQDAFIRVHARLDQLDDPARFGPWLLRTVTNLALNLRRSRKSRPGGSLDDALQVAGEFIRPGTGKRWSSTEIAGDGPLPEEVHQAIGTALAELPEKQRATLILFSIEGLPQKEVAEILDCSVELVKWNVFQARRKLREMLQDYLT